MKKVKSLLLASLAFATIFSSCNKDDDDAVAPEIGSISSQTIDAGDTLNVTFNVTAGSAKLQDDGVTVTLKEGSNSLLIGAPAVSEIETGLNVVITHTFAQAGDYVCEVIAIDKDGLVDSASFNITVKAIAPEEVQFDKEITTGIVWNQAGEGKGAWDLTNDVALSSSGTAADIQNEDVATTTFTGKFKSENGTSFVKVTLDYATASKTAAIAAYAEGTAVTEATPTTNDVYVAKNGENYYLILITAVDPTAENGANDGSVTFKYKK